MSWAARVAAEHTTHPPLAARLVGESFELAVKALQILTQGPDRELKFGHSLSALLGDSPPLEQLLRTLWANDLNYVVDLMDGECNPSQVRYGAGAGMSSKEENVIPSGYAETPDVWTSATLTLYEELMSSLGQAIWSNYPQGDRYGHPVNRRLKLTPVRGTPADARHISEPEEAALQPNATVDSTIWGFILGAFDDQADERHLPYWGIIPMDRLNDPDGKTFYVRARVSANMVADVQVTKRAGGFSVGAVRIGGHEEGAFRLSIHSALAVLPDRGEQA